MMPFRVLAIATTAFMIVGCISQEAMPQAEMQYQQVVDVEGAKQALYSGTLEWMAKSFNSSNAVIQFKDPDSGKIIGKGSVAVTYTIAPVDTFFTLTIELKDNRARFTFDQMYNETNSALLPSKMALVNRGQLDKFSERARQMVDDWKKYVERGTSDF